IDARRFVVLGIARVAQELVERARLGFLDLPKSVVQLQRAALARGLIFDVQSRQLLEARAGRRRARQERGGCRLFRGASRARPRLEWLLCCWGRARREPEREAGSTEQ